MIRIWLIFFVFLKYNLFFIRFINFLKRNSEGKINVEFSDRIESAIKDFHKLFLFSFVEA